MPTPAGGTGQGSRANPAAQGRQVDQPTPMLQPRPRLWVPPPVLLMPHDDDGDPDWGYMLQDQYRRRGRVERMSRFNVPGQTLQHPRVMDANEAAEQFYQHPSKENAEAYHKASGHVAGRGPALQGEGATDVQGWLDRVDREHRFAHRINFYMDTHKVSYMHPTQVALLRAIHENPDDRAAHGAYADWIEEHGDPLASKVAHGYRVQHRMADAVRSGARIHPKLRKEWREASFPHPVDHPWHGPTTPTMGEFEQARKRFALGLLYDPVKRAEQERRMKTGRGLRLQVPNPRMRARPQSQPGPRQMFRPGQPVRYSKEYIPLLHHALAEEPHDEARWGQLADVLEDHGNAPALAHVMRHLGTHGERRAMDLPGGQQVKVVHADPGGYTSHRGDTTENPIRGHVHGIPITVTPKTGYGRWPDSTRMIDSYAVTIHHPGTTNVGRMLANHWVGRKHAAELLKEMRPIPGHPDGTGQVRRWQDWMARWKDHKGEQWLTPHWGKRLRRLVEATNRPEGNPLDADYLRARAARRQARSNVRPRRPRTPPQQMRRPGRPRLFAAFPFLLDPDPEGRPDFEGPPSYRQFRELTPTRKKTRRFLNLETGELAHRVRRPVEDVQSNAFLEAQNQVARGRPAGTVWHHLDPAEQQKLLELHARFFPSGELGLKGHHELLGSMPGVLAKPSASSFGDELQVRAEHPDVEHWTVGLRMSPEGWTTLHHHNVFFKPRVQGTGVGTRAFRNQVELAAKLGLDWMSLLAGRKDNPVGQQMNGYYTWPLLGFNTYLPAHVKKKLPPEFRVTPDGRKVGTVHDLIGHSPEGRKWYKRHGAMVDMMFDLTPGSHSMQVLNRYLAEKGHPPVELTPQEVRQAQAYRQARQANARSHFAQMAVNRDQQHTVQEGVRLRDYHVGQAGMDHDLFHDLWHRALSNARQEHAAAVQEHQRRYPHQNAKISVLGVGHRVARHFHDLVHRYEEAQAQAAPRSVIATQRAQKAMGGGYNDAGWSAGKRRTV